MIQTLKISHPDDNIFMVSDLHYNHDKDFIYLPRGFKSVEESNEILVKRWNETVDNSSIVISLGDFIMKTDEIGFWNLVRRLNFGQLFLLWGNHFSGQKQAYEKTLYKQFPDSYNEKFGNFYYEVYPLHAKVDENPNKIVTFLPAYVEASINKQSFILSHYPIVSHNGQSHKSIHISGHCHSNLPLTNKNTGKGFRLDVGIESFGRPINVKDIKRHLQGRDLDLQDHHGK